MATYVLVINGVGVVVSQDKIINAFVIVRVRWYLFEETSVRAVKSFSGDVKRQRNNKVMDVWAYLHTCHVDFDNTSYAFEFSQVKRLLSKNYSFVYSSILNREMQIQHTRLWSVGCPFVAFETCYVRTARGSGWIARVKPDGDSNPNTASPQVAARQAGTCHESKRSPQICGLRTECTCDQIRADEKRWAGILYRNWYGIYRELTSSKDCSVVGLGRK